MQVFRNFREAIEPLVDRLHTLGDSRPGDHRTQRDQIVKDFYLAYRAHGDQFVHDIISSPEDWITAFAMAKTMASSERTTPRQWLIERVASQWAKKAGLATRRFRLLELEIGRSGLAEADRLARKRFREIIDGQHDKLSHGNVAGAPVEDSSVALAAETQANSTEPPVIKSPAPVSWAMAPAPGGSAAGSAMPLPDPAVLEQRRVLLKGFVERYERARSIKVHYPEIAILAHRKNRSAVQKYLTGEAGDDCVRNIEEALGMSPTQVDECCKAHPKQLSRLAEHLSRLGPLGAPRRN